ncbi:HK97 gp10 family phage protein [bacterium]|nr:HK97 gp10 family phage protein [bacterium]
MSNRNFANELNALIKNLTTGLNKDINSAIEKVSDELINQLKSNSPRKTGNYAENWTKSSYNKKVFIGNTTNVNGRNKTQIPLINILEYSTKHGKPHVQKIFENNLTKLENIIISELEK